MLSTSIDTTATLTLALILGGMVFFAAIVAPAVFSKLPADAASQYLRGLFPRYYLYFLILSAVAGGAVLAMGQVIDGIALICVAALFLWARQVLMPAINAARDARHEDPDANSRFDRLHRFSVIINMIQMLVVLAALVRLG